MRLLLLFLSIYLFLSCTKERLLQISSPDGNVEIVLDNENGSLSYSLMWNGRETITRSSLSIFPDKQVEVINFIVTDVNTKWYPLWGQFSEVVNHYNELQVSLSYEGIPVTLYVRTYDGGTAFRFEIKEIPTEEQAIFYMEYGLSDTDELYMPAGERMPKGPIVLRDLEGKEELPKWQVPIVVESPGQGFLSLLESDLLSALGFDMVQFGFDKSIATLHGNNEYTNQDQQLLTPWRLILLEENIGDLVTSTIPLNVAAPLAIKDPSWIKPGKTMWDWRVHGYTAPDGFTYGINTESYLRFIDFAADHKIEYFLIDDAWYSDVSVGKIEMSSQLDLKEVMAHADEKKVGIILYYDQRKGDYGDEDLFPYYQSLRAEGIKYGFMGKDVDFSRRAIQQSAQSNLLIDFHDGPVPFTGVTRTYPNAITREYCHAQQDSRRTFSPESFIKMALINGIQGPLDMNNGCFDISGINAGARDKGPKNLHSLFTTVTSEAARTLIIFSGLVCLPDAPEAYAAKGDLFEFIQKLPVGKWDESKVLHAKMGDYISTARRSDEEWFIGSVYDESGGTLEIELDFLKVGKSYKVTYYEDTKETHYKTNPEVYQLRQGLVKKGDIVKASIAPGGGHCMWIRPK